MDEATRQGSEALGDATGEQPTPEELRRDIAETREELGDTVAALAEKTDVKTQAKRRVEEAKQKALHKKEEVVGKAKTKSPDSATAGAEQMAAKARENPLPLYLAGALVAGFLLGRRRR